VIIFLIGRRLGKNGLLVGMGSPRLIQRVSNLQDMNALLEIFNRELGFGNHGKLFNFGAQTHMHGGLNRRPER
jgi:hypothetical protein